MILEERLDPSETPEGLLTHTAVYVIRIEHAHVNLLTVCFKTKTQSL